MQRCTAQLWGTRDIPDDLSGPAALPTHHAAREVLLLDEPARQDEVANLTDDGDGRSAERYGTADECDPATDADHVTEDTRRAGADPGRHGLSATVAAIPLAGLRGSLGRPPPVL